jgi:group I intron endonuclease
MPFDAPTMRLNLRCVEWRPVGSFVAGTYRITNMVNGKLYNGSSANVASRMQNHRHALVEGTHANVHLQSAVSKYGIDAFTFALVDTVAVLFRTLTSEQRMALRPQLVHAEQTNIDHDESWNPDKGYNLARYAGSSLGVKLPESAVRKISEYQNRPEVIERARQRMLQWRPTDEQRANMAESHRGVKHSDERRRNQSDGLRRSAKFHDAMARPDVRQKISDNQRRRFMDPNERAKTSEATKNAKQVPWNSGLTKESDHRLVWSAASRQKVGDRMRGTTFSEERKQRMSDSIRLAHQRKMLAEWS